MISKRVVVDSNVLISATLSRNGKPAQLFEALRETRAVFLFSDSTWDELRSRLLQEKFDRYVSQAIRKRFLAQMDAITEWVFISDSVMGCRDPDDDKLWETAWLGEADCLVTGDKALLAMHPFRGVVIVSPADGLDSIVHGSGW